MKIDRQPTLAFIAKPTDNNAPKAEFDRWINTPTGQHSGDEYYWLHQQQLQDSSLKFDQQIQEPKHRLLAVDGSEEKSTTFREVVSADHFASQPLLNTDGSMAQLNPAERHILSPQENYRHYLSKQNQQAVPFMALLTSNNTADAPETKDLRPLESRAIPTPLKKHHLYIQNNEVELSLNTQELNHHEEQELRQMIRLNIKNKGLSLKQLLINGVKK